MVVVGAVCLVWSLGRLPSPRAFLTDAEYGHQLSAALQILRGEHPFVDVRSTYGPLRFYTSALAQVLSGHRILGELALDAVAYAAAYVVLFRLLLRASGSVAIALVLEACALILMPRTHKYFVVLMPLVVLWSAWRYADRPDATTLRRLALAVVLTGLFRPDFGVYGAFGATAGVWVHPADDWRARGRRVLALVAALLAWTSPWLLWLAVHGALGEYLLDSSVGAARHAAGMSLPFPTWETPGLVPGLSALAFGLSGLLPALAVGVLGLDRARITAEERRLLPPLLVLAQCTLLQATHRSDFQHLLQSVPVTFVVVAWLAGRAWRLGGIGGAIGLATLGCWAAVMVAAVPAQPWRVVGPRALVARLRVFAETREEYLHALAADAGDAAFPSAVGYIRACTEPDARVLALPALASVYYLSDRSFAGGQIALQPGYFTTEADQRRMVARLSTENVPVMIEAVGYVLDGRPDRAGLTFAPIVADYLEANFVEVGRFGSIAVRVARGRVTAPPEAQWGHVPCPRRPAT